MNTLTRYSRTTVVQILFVLSFCCVTHAQDPDYTNQNQHRSFFLHAGETLQRSITVFPVYDTFTGPQAFKDPLSHQYPVDSYSLVGLVPGVTYKLTIDKTGGNTSFDVTDEPDKSKSASNASHFEVSITIPDGFVGPVFYGPIDVASALIPDSILQIFLPATTEYSITLQDPSVPSYIAPASNERPPNGSLIKAAHNPTVFLIENGNRRGFPSEYHLDSWFFGHHNLIIVVTDFVFQSYPLGEIMPFKDGSILAFSDRPNDKTIFVVENGLKRGFETWADFRRYGYSPANILRVPGKWIDSIPKGHDMVSLAYNVTHQFEGFIDYADCKTIGGWVADRNNPNTSFDVEVFDGPTSLGRIPASESRPDVGFYLHDDGFHGFKFATPVSMQDGREHSIHVKIVDFGYDLGNYKTLTCGSLSNNYDGYLDSADCNQIYGWAADRNRLNTPINVGIYADNQLVQTVLANGYRAGVDTYLGDNGLHGFTISLPDNLKNNGPHTITARFETSSIPLINTKTVNCQTTPKYDGYLDFADCNYIYGWAADRNRLNTPIDVGIYADNQLIQTVLANGYRAGVDTYLGDNGQHGFTISLPDNLKNNGPHTITARFETSSTPLINTKTVNCTTQTISKYDGYLDFADCNYVYGWAADRNRLNTPINVGIYADNQLIQTVLANGYRAGVDTYLGDNGQHGFTISLPDNLKNNGPHTITARFETSSTPLINTKTVNCQTTPKYDGYLDFADCNQIYGWAADRNRLNTPINVGIYADNQLIQTVLANGYRPGVDTYLGDNGQHGFTIFLPNNLKNNGPHTITARFENSSTQLINTKTINCPTAVPPTASFTINGGGQSGANGQTLNFLVPVGGSINFTFNGSNSSAGTGSITSYEWRISTTFLSSSSSLNYTLGHGSHFVELKVTNSAGLTNTTNATIVINEVPRVDFITPSSPTHSGVDQDVTISGLNFQTNLTVLITFPSGGSTLLSGAQVRNVTPTSFVMRATLSATGPWRIQVNNPNGGQSNSFAFTVR